MRTRFRCFLALGLLLALAAPVSSDPVSALDAADVRVHDQSADARAAALVDALAQVLVKLTGSQTVLETAQAQELLQNPARFLQQYRYESVQPVPVDPAAPRLILHAQFDAAVLERNLRGMGFALWGRERPLTLAWVAMSDSEQRHLLAADPADPVTAAVQRAAQRRGLPIKLPVMDSEDATRVSFMDVWGVFEEPLLVAAERYAPDAVLVGNIFAADGNLWASRWTLLREDESQRWEISGASPEAVATGIVDALAEYYAQEFAVGAAADGDLNALIEVTEVAGLQDYATLQSYLSGLSVVKDARLQSVDGQRLRFKLELNSTVRSLEQAIALGRVLEALPPEETVVHLGPAPGATSDDSAATEAVGGEGASPAEALLSPVMPPRVLRYRFRR